MSAEVASNQLLLKGANRMTVMRRLCACPGMSRSELAVALGLTRSTVTTLVRELLADGWLMQRGVAATGEVGRRPTPLFIDPQRLLLLGAEVGVGRLRVVSTSLTGEVLDRMTVGFDPAASAEAALAGQADPGGRLPLTCYVSVADLPAFENVAGRAPADSRPLRTERRFRPARDPA